MKCSEINHDYVSCHIPHVIQSLYVPEILKSTSLVEIRDAFRPNQMQCKAWLLDNIKHIDRNKHVLVVGSWMGFTSYCLFKEGFSSITETDIDSRLEPMARFINLRSHGFKHMNHDVNDIDLSGYDLIINTSCEHIIDNRWFDNIKPGTIVALQSTNLKSDDHINTVDTLEEMKSKYPLDYTYTGYLELTPIMTRFMLIGEKP